MVKRKRKKKNCAEANGKRWTSLNGESVNRKDLNETNGEIANGNHVRRSNSRNEKHLEIESPTRENNNVHARFDFAEMLTNCAFAI